MKQKFSLLIIFLHFLQTTEQVSNVGPSKNEKTPTIKCSKCPSSKSRSKTLLVSVKLSDNAILSVLFCFTNVFVYFDIALFWFGASSKHLQRSLLSPTNKKSSSVESAVYRSIFSEPKTETLKLGTNVYFEGAYLHTRYIKGAFFIAGRRRVFYERFFLGTF